MDLSRLLRRVLEIAVVSILLAELESRLVGVRTSKAVRYSHVFAIVLPE